MPQSVLSHLRLCRQGVATQVVKAALAECGYPEHAYQDVMMQALTNRLAAAIFGIASAPDLSEPEVQRTAPDVAGKPAGPDINKSSDSHLPEAGESVSLLPEGAESMEANPPPPPLRRRK